MDCIGRAAWMGGAGQERRLNEGLVRMLQTLGLGRVLGHAGPSSWSDCRISDMDIDGSRQGKDIHPIELKKDIVRY
jgi:hypothetical protein